MYLPRVKRPWRIARGWRDQPAGHVLDVIPNPKRYYWIAITFLWWDLEISIDLGFVNGRSK